ncbi:MAG: Tyrosine recombinase XerC [Eubacteriales bacterium SKADARSKE-1]|nr:Tyrosine recombinase XerC [Eubacteriales bacterium SKADARSKE-1]
MQWLEKKKDKVEIITFEGDKTQAEKHIFPYFQKKKLNLSEIKPSHIADYYENKFRSGRLDGKKGGLSIRTIKMQSFIIKSVLEEAAFYELILRNPAAKVPLPKKEDEESKGGFLDAKEANDVLKLFRDHHLQPLIYMTLYYGLRRSEVLGLKWSAIDFENDIVEIKHTVVKNLTIVAKDKTKTAAGKRKYALLPEIKDVLIDFKNTIKTNKKNFGDTYINTDYVFTCPDGKPYRPDYITKEFQKVLANNDFPKMRFHDLRHSCASILYDKGWGLKDIQTWLGHAGIETTADIYTHISHTRKKCYGQRYSKYFFFVNNVFKKIRRKILRKAGFVQKQNPRTNTENSVFMRVSVWSR